MFEDYHCTSGLTKEMISFGKLIEDGWKPKFSTTEKINLNKGESKIECKRNSINGMFYLQGICVLYMSKRQTDAVSSTEMQDETWKETIVPLDEKGNMIEKTSKLTKMDTNEAHDKMGHKGENIIKKTFKKIGCNVTGTLHSCKGCALAKAKQRAVSKTTNIKAEKPGQRIFLDISGPFKETPIGNNYMIQVVDDYSRYGIVAFCKKRNDLQKWVREDILAKFKALDYKIEYLHCDNAGEKKSRMVSKGFQQKPGIDYTKSFSPVANDTSVRAAICLALFNMQIGQLK
jgi:hypothetical protein